MRKTTLLLALAASTLAFVQCKKDDDTTTPPATTAPTRTDMIAGTNASASKGWVLESVMIAGFDATDDMVDTCQQDNIFKMFRNGNMTEDAGAKKCDESEPQEMPGHWWMNTKQDTFFLDRGGDTSGYKIIEVSNTRFRGDINIAGAVARFTFKPQ